jgi:hypothetical protein
MARRTSAGFSVPNAQSKKAAGISSGIAVPSRGKGRLLLQSNRLVDHSSLFSFRFPQMS